MTANDHVSLWGGRFSGAPADALSALSVSTHFDWRLAGADIAGSHAHADALHAVGLLSDDEARRMHEALRRLDDDVRSGAFKAGPDDEDVHTALERGLIERAGPALGGKLRAGRSRNDQIATLIRIYLRDEARHLAGRLLDIADALVAQAKAAGGAVPIPGVGGVGGASNTAYVTLDIRLIDNQTSEVVYAAAERGASNQTLGGLVTKYGGFGAGKINGILDAATRKAVVKHVEAMRSLKLD